MRKKAFAIVVTVLGIILAVGYLMAGPTTGLGSHRIPFHGFLEQNGEPVNGKRQLTFCLYQSEVDTAPCVWSESLSVPILDGNFSVMLGETTALDETIATSKSLYLGISVQEISDGIPIGTPILLTGRQAIGATAYAWRGAPGADFQVDGDLDVDSNAAIGGDLTVGVNTLVTDQENVGVGTANPIVKLDVAGAVRSANGGFHFPDDTVQTTAVSITQNSCLWTANSGGHSDTTGRVYRGYCPKGYYAVGLQVAFWGWTAATYNHALYCCKGHP